MKSFAVLLFSFCFVSALCDGATFPETWIGEWEGEMQTEKGPLQMRLCIEPLRAGRVLWKIQYSGEAERVYELSPRDAASGYFELDERNGITIDHFYKDGTLFASFVVNEKLIHFQYTLTESGIHVSAPMFDARLPRSTRSFRAHVCSFQFLGRQHGLLKKK